MTTHLNAIPTKDAQGTPNGFVLPIWNGAFDKYRPEQCYLTVIAPGCSKGPHLHLERAGAFTCIRGNVILVMRENGKYREHLCGEGHFKTVFVPAGVPACLYNITGIEAFVINMPVPAWRDNSDEHTVENWTYSR